MRGRPEAFAALDSERQAQLEADLTAVIERANVAPGSLVVPGDISK